MEEASSEVQTATPPPKEGGRPKRVRAVPGRFGSYGGRYVPETLMAALQELETAYAQARKDKSFRDEYHRLLADFAGRPTPLFLAERLTKELGGAKVYLKREDLLHTGAHKINNCIGQALASTASPPQPYARCLAWSAWCTWAPRTCGGRSLTSSACGCWAPKCAA